MDSYRSYHSYRQNDFKLKPLSAFGFYGGKKRLARRIAELLDYDNTTMYAELCGGSAAVLLNKPTHDIEVYADRSVALCCFWRCMSDKYVANELIERLYDTIYDLEHFKEYLCVVNNVEAGTKRLYHLTDEEVLSVAVACYPVYVMSRDNGGRGFTATRFNSNDDYLCTIGRLVSVAERFNGVRVVNADIMDLLNESEYNNGGVMLYVDAPYLPDTVPGKYYRYNFTMADHIRLLERLRDMDCKILLSGYDNADRLYDKYLIDGAAAGFKPWNRYEISTVSSVARGDPKRTEVLWTNF